MKSRVFIAGHKGMVGSAIARQLADVEGCELVLRSRDELDLTDARAVDDFFQSEAIDEVYLAAAKVGGIHANSTYPADFIAINLAIQLNVIQAAYQAKVQKLLFLGSSCIYPKMAPQPMEESVLLSGYLEPTNEPYAVAKIAGIKLCESFNRQYGTDYRSVMPTNLYGLGDYFHPENSHVIPALLQRIHKAKLASDPEVEIWGTGNAKREFLHVDDMAKACIHVMGLDSATLNEHITPTCSHINVGTGDEISIGDLARLIVEVTGYQGALSFDSDRPEGTPLKRLDVSKLEKLGFKAKIPLKVGLEKTYEWFQNNPHLIRQ